MIFSLFFSFLLKTIKTKSGIRLNLFLHLADSNLHQPLRHYLTLNHQLNSEYNKFTSHLLDIQSKGGSKFTYDFGEFERILNALQLALIR